MTELTLGIDDAGRGPVIGPMILAGCIIKKQDEAELKNLGVKDSKQLTQKRREYLSKIIKEKAVSYKVGIISPDKIDSSKFSGLKLNELEAHAAAQIINKLNQGNEKIKVILDCPSTTLTKWRDYLLTKIKNLSNLQVVCEHKADANHVSVAAASILAKCVRENEMQKLKEEFGTQIGSGYPSDPLTKRFLEKYAKKYQSKGIFRQTWSTHKKLVQDSGQSKLNL